MYVSGNSAAQNADSSIDVGGGGMVNLNCVDMPIELQRSFHGLRRVPLFYFDYCNKLNRKNKVQRRVVLMTLDHLYVCHPNGDILRCFPFHLVSRIIHDSVRYQVALIIPTEYDVILEVPDTFHMLNVFSTLRGLHPFDEPLEIDLVKRRLKSGFQASLAGGSYQPPSSLLNSPSTAAASTEDDPFFSQLGGYVPEAASSINNTNSGTDSKNSNSKQGRKNKGGGVFGNFFGVVSTREAADIEAEEREARLILKEEANDDDGGGGNNNMQLSHSDDDDEGGDGTGGGGGGWGIFSLRGGGAGGGGGRQKRKGAMAVKVSDWWFYAKQALPYLQRLPPGVIPNWNHQYYSSLNAEDRIRDAPEYRAKYERTFLFKILFKKENQSRLQINHEQIYSHDNDPFAHGENVAGHPNEVCIGRPPYTVRSAKPEGFRLCLYTGDTANGDEGEEYDVQD